MISFLAVVPAVVIPLIWRIAALVGTGTYLYGILRNHPDQDMASALRASQIEEVQRKQRELGLLQEGYDERSKGRKRMMGEAVRKKQGLQEGWISPVELGIEGGGYAARDMPLIQAMAARMGVDPQDLVAKFDPARSNAYVPSDRRGFAPRPTAKQLAQADAATATPTGPAQMNPMVGFGQ
jgi:hypothetical protein